MLAATGTGPDLDADWLSIFRSDICPVRVRVDAESWHVVILKVDVVLAVVDHGRYRVRSVRLVDFALDACRGELGTPEVRFRICVEITDVR